MAKIDVPDYVIDFYSLIYPNLDLNRIEFHWGIPKVFRIGRNPGAITLGSWISNKIWIHFKEGQWDPDTCEGIALIGHELYHAQDVYSMWGGAGVGG